MNRIPKPQLNHKPNHKPAPPQVQKKSWGISFKYFDQIHNFGLSHTNTSWFISLIHAFRSISKYAPEQLFTDLQLKKSFRFHEIKWSAKDIPINKSDINWVDNFYISNDEEFPFFQFQISISLGRVIGFWNEDYTIFFIVLLDPHHNLQPTKKFDYQIRKCYPVHDSLSELQLKIDSTLSKNKKCCDCFIHNDLSNSLLVSNNNVHAVYLTDDFVEVLYEGLKVFSLKEILENGILNLLNVNNN